MACWKAPPIESFPRSFSPMTAKPSSSATVATPSPWPLRTLCDHPLLVCAAFLLVFVPVYTWVSWRVGPNSDNAAALMIAKDIAAGNVRAEDWVFSTQPFLFSDNIWAAIVIAIFGYSPIVIHVVPALYLALTALFAALLVLKARPSGVVLLAPFLLIPNAFTTLMGNQLASHGGAAAMAMASVFLLGYVSDRWLVPALAVAALVWGIVTSSDALLLVIFFLPAILAAMLHLALAPGRRAVVVLAALLAGLAIYFLAGKVFDHLLLSATPGVGHQGLARPGVILRNVGLLVEALREYFAVGFRGGVLDAVLSTVRLLFLLGLLAGFAAAAVRAWRKSFVDTFLLLSAGTTACAFVFSTMTVDVMSARYLFFGVLAGIVFVARNIDFGRLAKPLSVALVLLALTNIPGVLQAVSTAPRYADLAQFLRENGLTRGYAGFWQSHVTSVTGDVEVAPVWAMGTIRPFYWLAKTTWYGPGRTFFMTPDPSEKAVALAQFGPPVRELRHGDMEILVWDEISMPMMGFIVSTGDVGAVRLGPFVRREDGFGPNLRKGTFLEEVAPSLPAGRYRFTMDGVKDAGSAEIVIDAPGGAVMRQSIAPGDGRIADFTFALPAMTRDLRIRVKVRKADDLVVRGYGLYRIGD